MKVLVLYEYPPSPGGLSTQGDLLYKGLLANGVDAHAAHIDSDLEKEWYYKWFKPDIVVGIGYWGHIPKLVLHPQKHGILAIPWLVADGYIVNFQHTLNELPLILVTSNWVKDMYVRDGIKPDNISVLPVGCDTLSFQPYSRSHSKVQAVRNIFGLQPEELMILTVGGDAASKGGREVMQALSKINKNVPPWKYICKVWPQPRTELQNILDKELAFELGIADKVIFSTDIVSRDLMPYLISACDIYAAPSRLEGFGMPQIEAGACAKPVIGIQAMGMLDTLIHNRTALLARVKEEIITNEVIVGLEAGFEEMKRIVFDKPRTVDYRANIEDITEALNFLIPNATLRNQMGITAYHHISQNFDYKIIAKHFIQIVNQRFNIY